jgi:hypothetical protein
LNKGIKYCCDIILDNASVGRGFAGHAFFATGGMCTSEFEALDIRTKPAGFFKKTICDGGTRTID